jgi:DNA gyrase subunit A
VVLASGKVVRSSVAEVPAKGRDTMGVVFARFENEDRIIALAKNSERNLEGQDALTDESAADETPADKTPADDNAADQTAADETEKDDPQQ